MLAKSTDDFQYDFYLLNIAQAIRYLNDQKLTEYCITNRQARLLGILYRNIQNNAELNNKKLQETMNLTGPSVTSLLNGLEKNGFIIRNPKAEDKRVIAYQLTDKSLELMQDMQQVFANTEKQLLKTMSKEEKHTLLQLLAKAYANIAADIPAF